MSGADLANVCNEGALMAARQGQKSITFDNFNKERVIRCTVHHVLYLPVYSHRDVKFQDIFVKIFFLEFLFLNLI